MRRRKVRKGDVMRDFLLLTAGLCMVLTVTPAQAQPAARPPAAAPAPSAAPADPALEAAERAFMALDEPSRRAILDALMWTGDYNGVVGVNFGKRGYDGIRAFQKKRSLPQSGILDDAQRAALLAEGKRARDSVRFAIVNEARSGMKIGVPQRVLESAQPIESGALKGMRYRSNDGAMTLDAATWPVTMQTLDQFLAQGLEPKPNRKVTYKLQRPDFVVMSGEENGRTFYTRAALNGGTVRGYTFSYPAARKGDFERVMLAVANSFDPFPGTQTASAPAAQPVAGPQPAVTAPPRPRLAGTGIVTGPGRVLTSAAVLEARCNLTVRGMPAQPGPVENGFIVLTVAGLAAPAPLPAKASPVPGDGQPVIALAYDGATLSLVSGSLTAGAAPRFTGGLGDGAAGTPVFDPRGHLVGLVRDNPKPLAVASLGAPVARSHALSMPPGLGTTAGVSDEISAGAIAAKYAASVVPISCAN